MEYGARGDQSSEMCYYVFRELSHCVEFNAREQWLRFYTTWHKLNIPKTFDLTRCNQYKDFPHKFKTITQLYDFKTIRYLNRTSFDINLTDDNCLCIKYNI